MKYYGMPYKGSKSQIAHFILSNIPPAKHFYDLFGGGGSVSHLAALLGKWQYIHYNEADPLVCSGFQKFVRGDFLYERRWIDRDEFYAKRNTDPYVSLVFSFGNNQRSYLYCREFEYWKRALHYALVLFDFRPLEDMGIFITRAEKQCLDPFEDEYRELYISWLERTRPHGTYRYDYEKIRNCAGFNACETWRRIKRLRHHDPLSEIIVTNLDYRDVQIEQDSVIYCDPPYLHTHKYRNYRDEFRHGQ